VIYPVRDHHGLQSIFFRFLANVDDVLGPDRLARVSKRQSIPAVLKASSCNILRRNVLSNEPDRTAIWKCPSSGTKKQPMLQPAVHAETRVPEMAPFSDGIAI